MTGNRSVSSALAALQARYADLETRTFIGRVCSALRRVDRDGNQEIIEAIRERVPDLRPSAFRIVPGPHQGWAPRVALVYAYLITPDGLPTQTQVASFTQLRWELDSTATHELVIVLVDRDGHETPMDMPSLAIGLDVARYGPHAQPEDE
jgi:hypothetical protein